MLVRAKAVEYFETSTIIPVKEVTQMLEDHKRARKLKVTTAPNKQNPYTTNGLSVSQFVIDEARVVQDTVTAAAAVSKVSAENERVERRQLKSATFELVLSSISCPCFNWSKRTGKGGTFNAKQLALALQEWMDSKACTKGKKVKENAQTIERKFKMIRVAFVLVMRSQHASNRLLVPE